MDNGNVWIDFRGSFAGIDAVYEYCFTEDALTALAFTKIDPGLAGAYEILKDSLLAEYGEPAEENRDVLLQCYEKAYSFDEDSLKMIAETITDVLEWRFNEETYVALLAETGMAPAVLLVSAEYLAED